MSVTQTPNQIHVHPIAVAARSEQDDVDDEKLQALKNALRESGHRCLEQVQVQVRDGLIVLRGCVASYYFKQLAQESIRPLTFGMRIQNELRVQRSKERPNHHSR